MTRVHTSTPEGSVCDELERPFSERLHSKSLDRKAITRIRQGMNAKVTKVFSGPRGVIYSEPMVDHKERREWVRLYLQASEQWTEKHEHKHEHEVDIGKRMDALLRIAMKRQENGTADD